MSDDADDAEDADRMPVRSPDRLISMTCDMPPPECGNQPPNLSLRDMTCALTAARTETEQGSRTGDAAEPDFEIIGEDEGEEDAEDEAEGRQWTGDEVLVAEGIVFSLFAAAELPELPELPLLLMRERAGSGSRQRMPVR